MDKIKEEIVKLADLVFKEQVPTKNIYVSRTGKMGSVDRKYRNLYQGSLFSNNLKELACGGQSANHCGALNELLKKIKSLRKEQLKNKMLDNSTQV